MAFFVTNFKFVQGNNILTLSKRDLMDVLEVNSLTSSEELDSDDWIGSWGKDEVNWSHGGGVKIS